MVSSQRSSSISRCSRILKKLFITALVYWCCFSKEQKGGRGVTTTASKRTSAVGHRLQQLGSMSELMTLFMQLLELPEGGDRSSALQVEFRKTYILLSDMFSDVSLH